MSGFGYVRDDVVADRPVGRLLAGASWAPRPRHVDLSPLAILADQGRTSSCTGQSAKVLLDVVQAVRALGLDRVQRDEQDQLRLAADALRSAGAIVPASALGLYCAGRLRITPAGQGFRDEGAHYRAVFEEAQEFGVVAEADMPFEESAATRAPDFDALTGAVLLKASDWSRIDSTASAALDETDACLAMGHPVGFASPVTRGFQKAFGDEGAYGGDDSGVVGLHAMSVVGYDLDAAVYLVQNSWGINWGNNHVPGVGWAGLGRLWVTRQWFGRAQIFDRTVVHGYVAE